MAYIVTSDHTETTWGPFVTAAAARAFIEGVGGDVERDPYWVIRREDRHEPNPKIYNYTDSP